MSISTKLFKLKFRIAVIGVGVVTMSFLRISCYYFYAAVSAIFSNLEDFFLFALAGGISTDVSELQHHHVLSPPVSRSTPHLPVRRKKRNMVVELSLEFFCIICAPPGEATDHFGFCFSLS